MKLTQWINIIRIQAQTGTGKTYFIIDKIVVAMESYQKLIYICNRTELKRQIKIDLLRKYGMEIPYKKNDKGEFILDKKGKKYMI